MVVGRPREFDVDKAIDRAMTLFWRKGYEGTSLTDLTATLGITRPSLYAAFRKQRGAVSPSARPVRRNAQSLCRRRS